MKFILQKLLFVGLLLAHQAMANSPPSISGTPATEVFNQSGYSFTPQASDANGDNLTFSISNKPSWASFDSATGRLWSEAAVYEAHTVQTTTQIRFEGLLDSRSTMPAVPLFRHTDPNSFNYKTTTGIVDSLGQVHELGLYFIKSYMPFTWDVRIAIKGVDLDTVAGSGLPNVASTQLYFGDCSLGHCSPYPIVLAGGTYSGISAVLANGASFANSVAIDLSGIDSADSDYDVYMQSHTGVPVANAATVTATENVYLSGSLYSNSSIPAVAAFAYNDNDSFNSVAGIDIYDSNGEAHGLGIYFAKSANLYEWNVFFTIDNIDLSTVAGSGVSSPVVMSFDASGQPLYPMPDVSLLGSSISNILSNGATFESIAIHWREQGGLGAMTSTPTPTWFDFKITSDGSSGEDLLLTKTQIRVNDGVNSSVSLAPFSIEVIDDIDTDGDGVGNKIDTDDDNDGIVDTADHFPLDPTEFQDHDYDGIGNNADPDDDNDGILDGDDAFPLDPTEWADTDNDGIGNNADDDDDNDGVKDEDDDLPLDDSETVDTDGDGIGNNTDDDDDNDGVKDEDDAFPLDKDETADTDGDGTGNNADTDDDNDSMPDTFEIEHGLNPLDASDRNTDFDNDGLNNYLEFTLGSSPSDNSDANQDYDGDGFGNLEEVLAGTDPANPASLPVNVSVWMNILMDNALKDSVQSTNENTQLEKSEVILPPIQ